MSPHEALRHYFGFAAFRPGQEAVLTHVLAGRNALVVMPTGSGKSLIYQLAALLLPDITLVISPLVALMKDQIDRLTRRGVAATCINSSLAPVEQARRLEELAAGRYKMVLVAPERLRNPAFRQAMAHLTVGLLAVDEAHCLSQWGHDFRPDYLHIAEARRELRIPLTLALTATATPRVQDDISELLGLSGAERLVTGFNRPNLTFDVQPAPNVSTRRTLLHSALRTAQGACLIYTGTRRDAEEVAAFVQTALGLPAQYYHGGLDPVRRAATQDAFLSGALPILVATNAFGMGIDRPDVRLVLHYTLPGTLEAYYQEAGRAGRDGLPARALLLYARQDVGLQEFFIENDAPSKDELRAVHTWLGRSPDTRVEGLGVATGLPQVKARVALAQLEAIGALRRRPGGLGVHTLALEEEALQTVAAHVAARRQYKHAQLRLMVRYATGKTCRRRAVLDHFGDPGAADAPHCCDICSAREQRGSATSTRTAAASPPLTASAAREALATVAHFALTLQQSKLARFLQGVAVHEVIRSDSFQAQANVAALRLTDIEALIDTLLQAGYLHQVDGDSPRIQLHPQSTASESSDTPPPASPRSADPAATHPARTSGYAKGSAAVSGQMLTDGRTPEQVAAERRMTVGTVYEHLAQLILAGHLSVDAVVSPEVQAPIRAAIAQVGQVGSLAPLKALLPADVSYHTIRCVVAAWNWERLRSTVTAPTPAVAPGVVSDLPIAPLRRWRQQQAAALGQPAWALCSEETLQHLALSRPQSLDDLHHSPGMSATLISTYGHNILAAIASPASTAMVEAICACVQALPGQLPRSGVAKLLVGSQSQQFEHLQTHPHYNRLSTYTRRDVLLQVDVLLEMGILQGDERGYLRLAAVNPSPHTPTQSH